MLGLKKQTVLGSLGVALLVSLAYLFLFHRLPILEVASLKTRDLYFKLRHQIDPKLPVLRDLTLVTIDDESIKRLSTKMATDWPLKRRFYAKLIEIASRYEPQVIALDLIFAVMGQSGDDFRLDDGPLIQAMKASGRVILASFVDPDGRYRVSHPDFLEASLGSGVANKPQDGDRFVRKAMIFVRREDGTFLEWSWEFKILAHLRGILENQIQRGEGEVLIPMAQGERLRVPVLADGLTPINYRFTLEDMKRVPLWQVLEGEFPEEIFRGKIVLVGTTSMPLHDYSETPLGSMPGVLMHANFLANLLAGDFLNPLSKGGNGVILFIFLTLSLLSSLRCGLGGSLRWFGIELLGLLVLGGIFFAFRKPIDVFSVGAAVSASFSSVTLCRYFWTLIENVRLQGEAVTDPLTGLYTRRFLDLRLEQELRKLAPDQRKRRIDPFFELSILMLDVDHFKKLNDTYGHPFGDRVLKEVGETLRDSTRQEDILVRYGGEEFCVVLLHTAKVEAIRIAEKIRSAVERKEISQNGQKISLTISVGVAAAHEDRLYTREALIQVADLALYMAKNSGRNRVVSSTV